jgi:hypothetical protein
MLKLPFSFFPPNTWYDGDYNPRKGKWQANQRETGICTQNRIGTNRGLNPAEGLCYNIKRYQHTQNVGSRDIAQEH